jgi:hypothetical protein
VPRRDAAVKAARSALASTGREARAEAFTAASRRAVSNSGNPAPGHEAAPDGVQAPSGAWPQPVVIEAAEPERVSQAEVLAKIARVADGIS